MTQLPTDDRLRAILEDVKRMGGIAALSAVSGVQVRTIYRHIGPPGNRPVDIGGDTRRALIREFSRARLLEEYGAAELEGAVEDWARRASAPSEGPQDGEGAGPPGRRRGKKSAG
jgi:hypothetical protein